MQHIDVFVLTKTKLDDTFPTTQLLVNGFSETTDLTEIERGGGVIAYIREDIPSKLLDKHIFLYDMDGLFVELNFRKCKWLLFWNIPPPS